MPRFSTQVNFLDQLYNEDGSLYAPSRYKNLVRINYAISKNCNTSYLDVLQLTPRERDYLWEFILEEVDRTKEMLENTRKQHG